ncbi:MAG: TraM recognition domain-containing protein [Myxococcota bacterium]
MRFRSSTSPSIVATSARQHPYRPKGTIAPLGTWKKLQLQDLHEHMLVTGAPGSGKTSCVVLPTVRRIVELGGAVICFTTKGSDRDDYARAIAKAGGQSVAVGFDTSNEAPEYVFDIFGYLTAIGASSTNIAEVIVSAMEVVNQQTGGDSNNNSDNDYFRDLARALIVHCITCLQWSGRPITFAHIGQLMLGSRVKTGKQLGNTAKAIFHEAYNAITQAQPPPYRQAQFAAAIQYLTEEWPKMGDRTAASVLGVWTGLSVDLEVGLAGSLEAPAEGQVAVSPATALEQGISLIIGPPIEASPRGGPIMQALWQACIRISLPSRTPRARTVVIVLDEFQASVSAHYLQMLLAMARSSRVGVLLATQSFATVTARFGTDVAKSLFGLPSTVVSCRNDCPTTNAFAAERIGKHFAQVSSTSSSTNTPSLFSTGNINHQSGVSWSEQERFIVGPGVFRQLKGASSRRPKAESVVQHRGQHSRITWSRNHTVPKRTGTAKRRFQVTAAIATAVTGLAFIGTSADGPPPATNAVPAATRHARRAYRPRTHVVRRGETLSRIARRYGVSLQAMKRANPLIAPDRIEAGAIVLIPRTR